MIHLRELPALEEIALWPGPYFQEKSVLLLGKDIEEGTAVDGAQVLANPLNVNDMIRPYLKQG